MNIFVLDLDPKKAAEYHADIHISKMILESAQMLSTVLGGPYKKTHQNHPCTVWVGESMGNAEWLFELAYHLNREWRKRYKHSVNHKSYEVIEGIVLDNKWIELPDMGLTPFAQAMPEQFKRNDPVASYRDYYKSKTFARWDHGPTPDWW